MATVELRFSALPEHVRTARLVAAAVARRAGVDEAVLDEVRLAVGEACSRAVNLHQGHELATPVRVVLTEDEKKFSIEVGDDTPERAGPLANAPGGEPDPVSDSPVVTGSARSHPVGEEGTPEDSGEMGLAVISGLVDDVEVISDEFGGRILMSWPVLPEPVVS